MPSCFVPDCNHHSQSGKYSCSFFSFPSDRRTKKKWEDLIRREDSEVKADSRVCSCHFMNEDATLLPTIFQRNGNVETQFRFVSPEKMTRKRRRPLVENQNLPNCDVVPSVEKQNLPNCDVIPSPTTTKQYEFLSTFHEAEKYFLRKEIETLKEEVQRLHKQSFGFFSMVGKDTFGSVRDDSEPILGAYNDLGWRFGVSRSTSFRVVSTFLPVLHKIVYQSVMVTLPSRKKVQSSLPLSFGLFKSCRVVVDCTEMRCQVPKRMDYQRTTYSSYKHFNTLKVLLGVAPNASIVYCSNCYPGSTSDKEIVLHCGIRDQLVSGDMVLADKGFLIADILPPGVTVNVPPFLQCQQFTPSQVTRTRNIAWARIHVERANARMKNFLILSYFPRSLFLRASMIVQICAGLINFQNPLIKEVEQSFYTIENEDNFIVRFPMDEFMRFMA